MPRDENRQNNALAVDTNEDIKDLLVDPSTGRLLMDITIVTEPGSPVLNELDKRDENRKVVALADNGSGSIIPLHIDSRNNLLFIDCVVE